MRRIAIEEHFATKEYLAYLYSRKDCPKWERLEDENHGKIEKKWVDPSLPPTVVYPGRPGQPGRLTDLEEGRLREMDQAGIDVSVLSLTHPGVEAFDASEGTTWAKKRTTSLQESFKDTRQGSPGWLPLHRRIPVELPMSSSGQSRNSD